MIFDYGKTGLRRTPVYAMPDQFVSQDPDRKDGGAVTGQYSKLKTPEAQLEYLLLFVCRSRRATSPVPTTLSRAGQMPVRPSLSSSYPESVELGDE